MKKQTTKMYKVLKIEDGKVISPFQEFEYGLFDEIIGKEFCCNNFDKSNSECSNGFYATNVEGLLYSINTHKTNRVFEVEMSGKNIRFNKYKHRWEKQKFIRLLEDDEVKTLIKNKSDAMEWNLYKCVYPVNPLEVENNGITEDIKQLLKQCSIVRASVGASVRDSVWASVGDSVWASVGASVRASVGASVGASVRASVGDSVWASVGASVGDSVWASVGANFHNIKDWKYVNHEENVYPFQCYVDLQEKGFIPSFDGKIWRLHAGKKAEIVFEIARDKLMRL